MVVPWKHNDARGASDDARAENKSDCARADEAESRVHDHEGAASAGAARSKGSLATFKMLCQGHDGKLCLFEDANGHYTVVRTDRLA